MAESGSLMRLDVLPARCSVELEFTSSQVRFRGVRGDGFAADGRSLKQHSSWSGWFDLSACPIELSWAAFEFAEGAPRG